jgi:hypothetical protein
VLQCNKYCEAGERVAASPERSAFYLTTGRQVVRAHGPIGKKESAPPSPEAHKFHVIKPFNLGMGKHT